MKPARLLHKLHEIRHREPSASHVAMGALLVMTILYASVMV